VRTSLCRRVDGAYLTLKKESNSSMKKKQITIDDITYTVSATTNAGVKDGIRMLKKSLKQNKKDKEQDGRV
jgi:hypothetical protein